MISLVRISLLLEASWPVQFAICVVFLHSDVQPYHLRINVQMCNSHFMKLKVIVAAFFFPPEDSLLIGEGLVERGIQRHFHHENVK